MSEIEGWRCYQPGDLNPQLNSFSYVDLMSGPTAVSPGGNPLSAIGEAISRSISPDFTRGTKASTVKAVVLGGYVIDGQEALSYNLNIENSAAGAESTRLQMLYVRVPEIHGMLSDPYCEDNSITAANTAALVEMHTQAAVPNWSVQLTNLIPGTLVEIEFTQGYDRAIVKKVLDYASSLNMSQAISAAATMNAGGGQFNKAFNEKRPLDPVGIVIHYTVTFSASDAVSVLAKRGYSYHYIVDKDGSITNMVDPSIRAIHDPKTNKSHIGIAFVNLGNDKVNAGKRSAPALSEWVSVSNDKWEPYPAAQLAAGEKLVKQLVSKYPKITEIIGHRDSSARKSDPGLSFPMTKFAAMASVSAKAKSEEKA